MSLQEQWCKKAPPTPELLMQYTLQPPPPRTPPLTLPSGPDAAVAQQLIQQADELGALLQNNHQVRGTWWLPACPPECSWSTLKGYAPEQ